MIMSLDIVVIFVLVIFVLILSSIMTTRLFIVVDHLFVRVLFVDCYVYDI